MKMKEALALEYHDIVRNKKTQELFRVVSVSKKRNPSSWNKYVEIVCKDTKNKKINYRLSHKDVDFVCSAKEYIRMSADLAREYIELSYGLSIEMSVV